MNELSIKCYVCLSIIIAFAPVLGCGAEREARGASERTIDRSTQGVEAVAPVEENKQSEKQAVEILPSPGSAEDHAEMSAVAEKYFGRLPYKKLTNPVTINPRPHANVILVVFDALNAKHLGAYGYQRDTSPHLDELARKGLVLTNYVSNSSWTRPSYTTIITGLSKKDHGVELEGGWRLKPEIRTMAERFKKAGYRTAGYTGNVLVRKDWGFDQGYHVYEDTITLGLKAFPRDSLIVDKALNWLEGVKDKPFFLTLFLTSTHPPYRPTAPYRHFLKEAPKGKIIDHPFKEYKQALPEDDQARIVAAYDDEVRYMDEQFQRIVSFLEENKKLEHTIILLTADHGEIFGKHNCYLHVYHMWEPVLRVPFVLVAPNIQLAGYMDDRPFTHLDILPTILDLVGIDRATDELAGVSLVRALQDLNSNRDRYLFSQFNAHGVRRQAIRKGRYKLIHHHRVDKRTEKKLDQLHPNIRQPNPKDLPSLAWKGERYEAYDLVDDPGELKNVFDQMRDFHPIADLLRRLELHVAPVKKVEELPEELIQALINTGYLRTREN